MIEPVAFVAVAVTIKALVCAVTAIALGWRDLSEALFGSNPHRSAVPG
jgi:hypothetical protein